MNTIFRPLLVMVLANLLCGCEGLQLDRTFKIGLEGWATLGGSSTRTNESSSMLKPPLREIWQYDARSGITASPLVRDSLVAICTLKGQLHVVNGKTGKRIGYISVDGAVTGTPVWNGTDLYIPISTGDELIESIDIQNGSKNWSAKFGQCESSPLFYQKNLYVTSLNGMLYCLNRTNGNEIWKYQTAGEDVQEPIRSSPAADSNLVIFGCDDGIVYAVDATTGHDVWKFKADQSIFASPIVTERRVIVGSLDGTVYCLWALTGKLDWSYNAHSRVYGAASANDSLAFVGTADGNCYALRLQDGTIAWRFQAQSVINCAPLVTTNLLYVGSLDRNLYALDVQSGKEIWHYEAPGRIKVSPVIWNGMLLVTSEDSYVTALK